MHVAGTTKDTSGRHASSRAVVAAGTAFVAAVALSLGIVGSIAALEYRDEASKAGQLARSLAAVLSSRVGAMLSAIKELSGFIAAAGTDYPAIQPRLASFAEANGAFVAYFAGMTPIPSGGPYLASDGNLPPSSFDQSSASWFSSPLADGEPWFSPAYPNPASGEPTLTLSIAVRGPSGRPVGVLGMDFPLAELLSEIESHDSGKAAYFLRDDAPYAWVLSGSRVGETSPAEAVSPELVFARVPSSPFLVAAKADGSSVRKAAAARFLASLPACALVTLLAFLAFRGSRLRGGPVPPRDRRIVGGFPGEAPPEEPERGRDIPFEDL